MQFIIYTIQKIKKQINQLQHNHLQIYASVILAIIIKKLLNLFPHGKEIP